MHSRRFTHRDNRINDDKDNIRDSVHDGGDDTTNSRDDRTLRQGSVNCPRRIERYSPLLAEVCGLVAKKMGVEELGREFARI